MSENKFNRNDPCPCGSGKKVKKCCFIFKGINNLDKDTYFIRLSDDKDTYVHYEGQDQDNLKYRLKKGLKGAAGWHKKEGENFIAESNADNLELVKCIEVLGNDGSLN